MKVQKGTHIPLYHQLRILIQRKIETGHLFPHQPIEPEWELSKKYQISRTTVRQAMRELEKDGLIYRKQGKGTFVSGPKISQRFVTLTSFTEECIAKGLKPSAKLLEAKLIPADLEVSRNLGVKRREKVIKLYRLRFADRKPVGLNLSYLPYRLCPDLMGEDLREKSLYRIIEQKYNVKITKVKRIMESVQADDHISKMLRVKVGDPILKIEGVAYLKDEQPIEYFVEYYME
jgi:GntR family transcriptional regulator